jgi:hypothetical protein
MQFETIADVYAANDKIRERFINIVLGLTTQQEDLLSENGRWTLGAIVEHLTKVEISMMRICHKILSKAEAEGKTSDGKVYLSQSFIESTARAAAENQKFEAPEIVQPEGGKPITESLRMMEQTRAKLNEMRTQFETIDGTLGTFPHPAFGNMNAHDWLVLIGGHEARHTAQIERILAQNNDR